MIYKNIERYYICFLFIIVFPIIFSGIQVDNRDLVIIVNRDNSVINMSRSEIKLTYLRKISKRWQKINKNIVPVDRKGNPETRQVFLSKVIGMSEDNLNRYFMERSYQNAELPPVEFGSDEEVINFVISNIGAIGYVSAGNIMPEHRDKLKVVYTESY